MAKNKDDRSRKVDFFEGSKEFKARTLQVIKYDLNRSALVKEYKANISRLESNIECDRNDIELIKTGRATRSGETEEYLLERIGKYESEIEKRNKTFETEKAAMERVQLGSLEHEKVFKESMKNIAYDDVDMRTKAARTFFKAVNLDISDTDFEKSIVASIGADASERVRVESFGKSGMIINPNKALKNIYNVAFEYLAGVNIVTQKDIPEYLIGYYKAKKEEAEKRKAKKNEKKERNGLKAEIKAEQEQDVKEAKEYDKKQKAVSKAKDKAKKENANVTTDAATNTTTAPVYSTKVTENAEKKAEVA